jgi:hypothetical protein
VQNFERNLRHGTLGTEFLARILDGNVTEFGTKYVNEQEKCPCGKLAQILGEFKAWNLGKESEHGILAQNFGME